ncbi:AraC family transcriptional regulator [Rhizobium sp. FKL33]|uniref:helix-turn-helix domain-containing protein n=1 Tax=Rhizobium sp. FKL33 TaxID=2562307 RepID=UPI0010C06EF3|nr:AraC family transcriptional regulator [Rhizobium sp. FKL33]
MNEKAELQLEFQEPGKPVETHRAQNWRGVSVQYSRLKLPREYDFKWDGACQYLAYHDLVLLDGEMEVVGDRPISGGDLRDKMTFVPKGQSLSGWAKPADRMNSFTVVCFDPSAMDEELQAEFSSIEARPHIYFKEEALTATMRKLAGIMADQRRSASQIYAETVGLTAALEMFRLTQEGVLARKAIAPASMLSKSRRELVVSYIAENLGNEIGLEDLASLCGLTRFHFARAFKATFHEPPHQYILGRRLDRAMGLLSEGRLSIAEIASATGFNGASQFARSFKAATGRTPMEFRRSA